MGENNILKAIWNFIINTKIKYCLISLFAIIIIFIIIPLLIIFIINFFNKDSDNSLLSPYYYSCIIGSLFSALAFIGVLATLMYQKKQTKIQYRTLNLQSDSLNKQNEAFQMQMKNSQIQRFENTFFKMLDLQQKMTNDLKYKHVDNTFAIIDSRQRADRSGQTIDGRNTFEHLFKIEYIYIPLECRSEKDIRDISPENGICSPDDKFIKFQGMRDVIKFSGIDAYEQADKLNIFDHYFRHLYHILKFIDESTFLDNLTGDIAERYKYASILRSTLSPYELVWIFYNCISIYGRDKFKPLIEKYSMLKNIRDELLANSKECLALTKNENGFPNNDYDYFSTVEPNNRSSFKYYLSAFFNKEELPTAIEKRKKIENV